MRRVTKEALRGSRFESARALHKALIACRGFQGVSYDLVARFVRGELGPQSSLRNRRVTRKVMRLLERPDHSIAFRPRSDSASFLKECGRDVALNFTRDGADEKTVEDLAHRVLTVCRREKKHLQILALFPEGEPVPNAHMCGRSMPIDPEQLQLIRLVRLIAQRSYGWRIGQTHRARLRALCNAIELSTCASITSALHAISSHRA